MKSKYDAIEQDLATKIIHGIYSAGSFLPSETELTELYGTSRETIRKSLGILLELGYIQKIRGKGSIVLDVSRFVFPVSGIKSFKELNSAQNMHSKTEVITLEPRLVPTKTFELDPDQQLNSTYIERLRTVNDEPIIIDKDYILTSVVPKITKHVAEDSLYNYFENHLNLDISYATKKITVETPSRHERELLQIPSGKDAVFIRSLTYLSDTTLFEFTESIHRADKFSFIDFARRQK
ncbi:trehalose operon repressor [Pediococcus stilesii]|uniref:Trehalose operon repressor n=1 Tax=Pediococcus stilesii TaxID=331679 RepID=A0A5R9BWW5_9LACO|nr:trehalose operon repressor [Pediococcus stilesii]TLQ05149.1 trehalose operon repressor [Pediococcus stilesii]